MLKLVSPIMAFFLLIGIATGQSVTVLCPGDGTYAPCPCNNNGATSHGCANSDHSNGALLTYYGTPSLGNDNFVLNATEHHASSLAVFIQGHDVGGYWIYGDGLRCAGGSIKRLFFMAPATAFVLDAPSAYSNPPSPATVSTRSISLGDVLIPGSVRVYQLIYRDANPNFCPPGAFNASNGLRVVWGS
jgi:hypothetical protein